MKKSLSILMVMIMLIGSLAACSNNKPEEKKENETKNENQLENKETKDKKESMSKKLKAVVTILPQAEWVKEVAGDLVEVSTLLPPGASPEIYQASPKEMIALEEADVYFTISVPVEVEGVIPNTSTKAKMVSLADNVAKVYQDLSFGEDDDHDHEHKEGSDHKHEGEHKEDADHKHEGEHKEDADHKHEGEHKEDTDHKHEGEHKEDSDHKHEGEHKEDSDHKHEGEHKEGSDHKHEDEHKEDADHKHDEEHHHHHHNGRDPHIWMSPKRVMVMVETIRDTLMEMDAANAETYKKNAEAYLNKLKEKSKELTEILSKVKTKSFIIMHPSMGYFADEFGLEQVSIEKEGKQATAEHLKHVIDFAKEHNIKVIFYQKEFDNNQAKTIASEIGGEVMELEPLAPNYLDNLSKVTEVFHASLNK